MTSRASRRAALGFRARAVAALLAVGALATASGAASAAPTPAPARPLAAVEPLTACVAPGGPGLLVLLLLDESGSLGETDPEAQRVAGAKAALAQLARIPQGPGGAVVSVQVAGFAEQFRAAGQWHPLDPEGLALAESQVEQFRDRDRGLDTDFAVALAGAQQSLRAATAGYPTGQAPCSAVLLFTDGAYSIEARTTPALEARGLAKPYAPEVDLRTVAGAAAAVAAGREHLCRSQASSGGSDRALVDELRADGTAVLTVALSTSIDAGDRAFLRALSTGQADGERCGGSGGAAGAYLEADRLGGLLAAFDELASVVGNYTPLERPERALACPSPTCPAGSQQFSVSQVLTRFHVLAETGRAGARLALTAPTGEVFIAGPGAASATVAGASLNGRDVTDQVVAVDADLPPGAALWSGTWSATVVDPEAAPGTSVPAPRIYVYGDLQPALEQTSDLEVGRSDELRVRVVDGNGEAVDAARLLSGTSLEATITLADGREVRPEVTALDAGTHVLHVALPPDAASGPATLDLSLTAVTADGQVLAPARRTISTAVLPPASYPRLVTTAVRLDAAVGDRPARGEVDVMGPEVGTGCVWFSVEGLEGPRAAGVITAATTSGAGSAGSCLRLAPGQRQTVTLEVQSERPVDALLRGRLHVHLVSEQATDVKTAVLPLEVRFERPVDRETRLAVLLGLAAVLVLAPVVILFALNLALRRLSGDLLRAAKVEVVSVSDRLHRAAPDGSVGPRLVLTQDDFQNVPDPSRGATRYSAAGVQFRARLARSPWAPPWCEASATGRHVAGLDRSPGGRGPQRVHRPNLDLGQVWLLSVPATAPPEEAGPRRGRLHCVVTDAVPDALEALVTAVENHGAAVLDGLPEPTPPEPGEQEEPRLAGPRIPRPRRRAGPPSIPVDTPSGVSRDSVFPDY